MSVQRQRKDKEDSVGSPSLCYHQSSSIWMKNFKTPNIDKNALNM